MTQSSGMYSLGVLGLTGTQRMVLASLCKLSRNRRITYVLLDSASIRSADIAVVDSENAAAVEQWKDSLNSNVPVILVSVAPLTNLESHQYNLLKNHLSGGLLQLLDRISVNELRQKAPVIVSDNVSPGRHSPASCRSALARALVIDDSLSVRTQMSLCLGKLGISCDLAEDGHQGLEKLEQKHYHLVFLDVILPDMDGYQVCKLIKRDPRTRRMPVVMLTSKGSAINKLQGTIAGCDRYLVKPAAERDVVKVIKDFLPETREHFFRPSFTTLRST